MQKRKDDRCRNWTFVLYPESAPADWEQQLEDQHLKFIVSPLHDSDKNEDGSPKKAHYHIVMIFEGNKSYEQIKAITDSLGQPIPQRVQSLQGSVRYLTHADNPEKAQYSRDDIRAHGGANPDLYYGKCDKTDSEILREICTFIRYNRITEFCDIVDIAAEQHPDDWFPMLTGSHAYFIGQYINSSRNKYGFGKVEKTLSVDPETGELQES